MTHHCEDARWYGDRDWRAQPQARVQIDHSMSSIPEPIARLAHDEYAKHHSQTFQRLQERGGLSVGEVIMLLADRVGRLQREVEALCPFCARARKQTPGARCSRHFGGSNAPGEVRS